MKTLITPLHVGDINGHRMRFFATPLNDGRPDFPWLALEDVHACIGFPPPVHMHMLRIMRRDDAWKMETIATADGPTVIVPHCEAQQMIEAMIEARQCSADVRTTYQTIGAEALKRLMESLGLIDMDDQYFAWVKAALSRHD